MMVSVLKDESLCKKKICAIFSFSLLFSLLFSYFLLHTVQHRQTKACYLRALSIYSIKATPKHNKCHMLIGPYVRANKSLEIIFRLWAHM